MALSLHTIGEIFDKDEYFFDVVEMGAQGLMTNAEQNPVRYGAYRTMSYDECKALLNQKIEELPLEYLQVLDAIGENKNVLDYVNENERAGDLAMANYQMISAIILQDGRFELKDPHAALEYGLQRKESYQEKPTSEIMFNDWWKNKRTGNIKLSKEEDKAFEKDTLKLYNGKTKELRAELKAQKSAFEKQMKEAISARLHSDERKELRAVFKEQKKAYSRIISEFNKMVSAERKMIVADEKKKNGLSLSPKEQQAMDRNNFIRASKKIEIQLAAKRMADGMTGVGVKFGINATRTQETLEKYGKGMIDVMKGREVPESVKNAHARAARGPEKRERKQLDLADYLPKKETAKAKTHGEPTKQKEKTKDKELGD